MLNAYHALRILYMSSLFIHIISSRFHLKYSSGLSEEPVTESEAKQSQPSVPRGGFSREPP